MRVQSGGCDYIMTISLEDFITRQKKFSDEFFDASKLSEEQKVERHKTFSQNNEFRWNYSFWW